MEQKQTDGYADRLTRALEKGPRPMSIRGLAQAMSGGEDAPYKHLRGSSYGGIRQYVAGRVTNPRIELLQAMADVLGVRAPWLCYDRGAMLEEEERLRVAEAKLERPAPGTNTPSADGLTDQVGRGFRDAIPEFERLAYGQRALWWALARVASSGRALPLEEGESEPFRKEAARVAGAVTAPLKALGVKLEDLSQEQADLYVAAVAQAIAGLAINAFGSSIQPLHEIPGVVDIRTTARVRAVRSEDEG